MRPNWPPNLCRLPNHPVNILQCLLLEEALDRKATPVTVSTQPVGVAEQVKYEIPEVQSFNRVGQTLWPMLKTLHFGVFLLVPIFAPMSGHAVFPKILLDVPLLGNTA